MERTIVFSEGEYYHLYNRGVEKRKIFQDKGDYHRMMLLLYLCNSNTPVNVREYIKRQFTYESLWKLDIDAPIVDIGAWCLMPNHFHLIVHESKKGGITKFMLKLTTAYSMYFNRKNDRVGSLMQGPFKAEHIGGDRYFQYLFSYVHLNPTKLAHGNHEWGEKGVKNFDGTLTFLKNYEYSSLPDYVHPRGRKQSRIIRPDAFPWKFNSLQQLNKELGEWLAYRRANEG